MVGGLAGFFDVEEPQEEHDEELEEDDDDSEAGWPADLQYVAMLSLVDSAYRGLMLRRGQEARMQ